MKWVIGIDEVGRGPLAGPVVLAAVAIPIAWRPHKGKGRVSLKDSKKLTRIQRERWTEYLGGHPKVAHVVVKSYPSTIDEVNIARAANLAARRALRKLLAVLSAHSYELAGVYLDGGLYLQKLRHPRMRAAVHTETVKLSGNMSVTAHTVIKGDEKIVSVRMASIFAKVHRDDLMRREAKKYPGYGFERHKGYATRSHYEALRRLGISPIHRTSFVHLVDVLA